VVEWNSLDCIFLKLATCKRRTARHYQSGNCKQGGACRMRYGQDELSNEYSDLTSNMRHYASMRFAQLTIFAAITAALLKFLLDSNSSLQPTIKELLTWGGFVISLVFWVMEISSALMWRHFARRAAELESKLGYRQYSTLPTAPRFTLIGRQPGL
jgi:hypothetical protein